MAAAPLMPAVPRWITSAAGRADREELRTRSFFTECFRDKREHIPAIVRTMVGEYFEANNIVPDGVRVIEPAAAQSNVNFAMLGRIAKHDEQQFIRMLEDMRQIFPATDAQPHSASDSVAAIVAATVSSFQEAMAGSNSLATANTRGRVRVVADGGMFFVPNIDESHVERFLHVRWIEKWLRANRHNGIDTLVVGWTNLVVLHHTQMAHGSTWVQRRDDMITALRLWAEQLLHYIIAGHTNMPMHCWRMGMHSLRLLAELKLHAVLMTTEFRTAADKTTRADAKRYGTEVQPSRPTEVLAAFREAVDATYRNQAFLDFFGPLQKALCKARRTGADAL
jgi:hypothetical protein